VCLGPVNPVYVAPVIKRTQTFHRWDEDPRTSWLAAQFPRTFGIDWEKIEREELARMKTADAKRAEFAETMYAAYGMTLGPASLVPIDKPVSMVDLTAVPAAAAAAEVAEPDAPSEPAPDDAGDTDVGDASASDSEA
jgi:hypothetical protein